MSVVVDFDDGDDGDDYLVNRCFLNAHALTNWECADRSLGLDDSQDSAWC